MACLLSDEGGTLAAPARAAPGRPRALLLLSWFLGSLLLGFVLLPILSLAVAPAPATLWRVARLPEVHDAIALSLEAAFLTALVTALLAVPLAYGLARGRFRGKPVIAAIIDLPLAVPHTVAGIALMMVLGRHGLIGAPAAALGISFWGTLAGIVAAMLFVSAPYTVNAARQAFEAVDPRLEKVARTLGLGPWRTFLRVSLPLAWRGILAGLTLTFARSLSEFGAVVIIAYYPMTAPVRIYEMFLRFGLDDAAAAAALLLAVSLLLFLMLRALAQRGALTAGGR